MYQINIFVFQNEILLRRKHFDSDDDDDFETSSLQITGQQWRTQSKTKV